MLFHHLLEQPILLVISVYLLVVLYQVLINILKVLHWLFREGEFASLVRKEIWDSMLRLLVVFALLVLHGQCHRLLRDIVRELVSIEGYHVELGLLWSWTNIGLVELCSGFKKQIFLLLFDLFFTTRIGVQIKYWRRVLALCRKLILIKLNSSDFLGRFYYLYFHWLVLLNSEQVNCILKVLLIRIVVLGCPQSWVLFLLRMGILWQFIVLYDLNIAWVWKIKLFESWLHVVILHFGAEFGLNLFFLLQGPIDQLGKLHLLLIDILAALFKSINQVDASFAGTFLTAFFIHFRSVSYLL